MEYIHYLVSFLDSLFDLWWSALSLELQIFYAIGMISTFILLVQSVLMVIGIGGDGGMDDLDFDASHDVQVLSLKTITAFFVGFGWTGVLCIRNDFQFAYTVLTALGVGSGFMLVTLYLMKMLYGLRSSGNIHYQNAIGTVGTVYIPIPARQAGAGQVEITVQGRLRFVDAYTDADEKIAGQTKVKIKDLIDPVTVLVEPLSYSKPEDET